MVVAGVRGPAPSVLFFLIVGSLVALFFYLRLLFLTFFKDALVPKAKEYDYTPILLIFFVVLNFVGEIGRAHV